MKNIEFLISLLLVGWPDVNLKTLCRVEIVWAFDMSEHKYVSFMAYFRHHWCKKLPTSNKMSFTSYDRGCISLSTILKQSSTSKIKT